ncbi:hypothetical protein [Mycobacterium sp.]|uniref:hypothetical protein n=1 Tax=Mycobacterium sp. TaxID=1785 RepID=UPI002C73EAF3|nr:hypothetical protein [Mycobacterium sp.]HTQ18071.1 hypothetical protein [Mycobacterium sp.]
MIGSPLVIAQKARARLDAILSGQVDAAETIEEVDLSSLPDATDLVITACEVNPLHGTGTLLLRIFPDQESIISLRAEDFYDGETDFGRVRLRLPLAQAARPVILAWLKSSLAGVNIRRILCVPYTPAEATLALAAHDLLNAPLGVYVMDDKNVCADGITDTLMQELLSKSSLRLVIGPEMREAYEEKYEMPFWVMPPVVADHIIKREAAPASGNGQPRGVLLGNIWGQRWLDMLREIFRGSGVSIDWYCNQINPPGLEYDRDELAADGIVQRNPIAEDDLPKVLGEYSFAVVPTDTLDGRSPLSVQAIAELSLPSRMVTMMATSHLPMLVVGSPATCAAGFVERFDLGAVAPYDRAAVLAAIEALTTPDRQADIRARSARLSGSFTAAGTSDWLWRSLDAERPITSIYEDLMPKHSANEPVAQS